ncbi:MAG: hypothetical protein QOH31_1335 [Verrucomicrobiota bacterium]|jgi:hypothetical protein
MRIKDPARNGFLYSCEFASIRGFILKLGILANRDMVRL